MFVCEKNYSCCDHRYWDSWKDVDQDAKDCGHLIEVEPVKRGEWISVDDRLPEKDEYVFCRSNMYGGEMFIGYRGWRSGEWMDGGVMHVGDVTHWMPLPEPPNCGADMRGEKHE